jgi:hypothetical protein
MTNLTELPPNLPSPIDDGASDHLPGLLVPSLRLPSTEGRSGLKVDPCPATVPIHLPSHSSHKSDASGGSSPRAPDREP